MEILVMISQLILGLTILVSLHEFGHYIAARMFGIRVEKYFIFFDAWGYKLFSFTRGNTEYGVGWLPLGGYVKISGMIDESMDTEQLKQEPKPWEFRSKPAWQRLIVMVAGVVFNIVLGILIFSLLTFKFGETYTPVDKMKYGIEAGPLGEKVGFHDGDKILKVNGKQVKKFREIFSTEVLLQDNATVTVLRDEGEVRISIPPGFANKIANKDPSEFIMERTTFTVRRVLDNSNADKAGIRAGDKLLEINGQDARFFNRFKEILEENTSKKVLITILRDGNEMTRKVKVDDKGKIGFVAEFDLPTETEKYSFFSSFARGTERGWDAISQTFLGLIKLIQGELSPQSGLQGPISIAKNIYGGIWLWSRFWEITALLSLIIGFMNILPIPALDGGHVIFLLIEIVRGKPLSDNVLKVIQTIGMSILIALMIFVIFNDIWRIAF